MQALLSLVLLLALILGFGLFSSIRDSLAWIVERQPDVSPVPAFLLVSLGSLLVFLLLRRRHKQIGEPAPARRRGAGALLGLLRGLGMPITEAVQQLAARIRAS